MSWRLNVINVVSIIAMCNGCQCLAGSGAKIFCTETSSKLLKDVKSRCVHYKQRVQALLLKQEYRRLQTARKQKMMEKLNDNFTSFIV